ncbi:MAG: stage sporulation protein [Bacillota bacterium]
MLETKKRPDLFLIIIVASLLMLGIVMIYSASAALANYVYKDAFYFVKKQLLFAGLGVGAVIIVLKFEWAFFERMVVWFLLGCHLLLMLVLIPGIGLVRNGAKSWLGIGAFSIQPAEFTKLALVMFLAWLFAQQKFDLKNFWRGLVPACLIIGLPFGLIMLQPDLGTGMVLVGAATVVIFVAGARYKHLIGFLSVGVVGFILLVLAAPYRLKRLVAFVDPWQDPLGAGYQLIQSLYALGPGRLIGLGYGMSRQKYLYLPEPHTDFIYSIISEELGFVVASLVIILFTLFAWRGFKIALQSRTMIQSLTATGITSMIVLQAILNIGVVIGLFPVTGITLPFLSYGGSSLTLTLVAVGILLNISRYTKGVS